MLPWRINSTPKPQAEIVAAVVWADDVLDALVGGDTELTPEVRRVVGAMEILVETLADEPDGSVRTMARALANRVLKDGLKVKTKNGQSPYEVLSEALGWFLGADLSYQWEPQQPSAESVRSAIEGWVAKVAGTKGVGASQAKAVEALVLHDASPYDAKAAARAAYAGAQ